MTHSWIETYIAVLNAFDRNKMTAEEAEKALSIPNMPAVARKHGVRYINKKDKR